MKSCFSTVLPLMAFFLVTATLICAQPYRAGDYTQLRVELMEILDDLRWVEQQLDPIRQAAAEHEEVVSLRAACDEKELQAMIDLEPDHEADILRWKELSRQLQVSPERIKPPHEQSRAYREMVDEFERLKVDIIPILEEAVLKPEVRDCRRELKEKEREVMLALEPRARDWLLREESLNEAFRRLQERAEEGR